MHRARDVTCSLFRAGCGPPQTAEAKQRGPEVLATKSPAGSQTQGSPPSGARYSQIQPWAGRGPGLVGVGEHRARLCSCAIQRSRSWREAWKHHEVRLSGCPIQRHRRKWKMTDGHFCGAQALDPGKPIMSQIKGGCPGSSPQGLGHRDYYSGSPPNGNKGIPKSGSRGD